MERLTEKHFDGKGYFMKCSEACANDDEMCGGCPQLDKIIDRLAAYEDTGLAPEQIGKPLAEFLHPVDSYGGLKGKYLVFKADTGEQVVNCFVLRPDKDPAAVNALRAYAQATDNDTLAGDIYNWVGKGVVLSNLETPTKWIPVSERLPEAGSVLCITQGGHYKILEWLETFKCWQDPGGIDFTNFRLEYVTHWMPLPMPPEEE